jgi:hypothetical protein
MTSASAEGSPQSRLNKFHTGNRLLIGCILVAGTTK